MKIPKTVLGYATILLASLDCLSGHAQPQPISPPALGALSRYWVAVFSHDAKRIITNGTLQGSNSEGDFYLWDADTGVQIRRFSGHTGTVRCVAWSPDEKTVASGGGANRGPDVGPALDTAIRLWNAETGQEILQLKGHGDSVSTVHFSADGKRLLSFGRDDTARLWDIASGRELFVFGKGWVVSGGLSPDGQIVFGFSLDQVVLWNADTGRELVRIALPEGQKSSFTAVAFAPDGKQMATASLDMSARIWDIQTGRQIQLLSGHTKAVEQVAFSADGHEIITAADDDTARLWDAVTGKVKKQFDHPGWVNRVSLSPDGKRLLSLWTPQQKPNIPFVAGISLWDVETGAELRRITTHQSTLVPGPMIFVPDGKKILVHVEQTELLDSATGKTLQQYK